jgi:hypothetical protein
MQPCRLCGNIIPVAKPYDPTEDWICSECAKEFGGHARRINEEDLQKAIQSSLDAYRGQDPGGVFQEEGQKALDQRDNESADAGHEGETI